MSEKMRGKRKHRWTRFVAVLLSAVLIIGIIPITGISASAAPASELSFADVKSGAFYEEAVKWAVKNGVTKGTSATTFSPNDSCTRAQAVTFLYRADAGKVSGNTGRFLDVKNGAYYMDAINWAVASKITVGTSKDTFSPDERCTRGQIVTFLWRLAGRPTVSKTSNFVDVKDNSFYKDAVNWAVSKKITFGTSSESFSPNEFCRRGQIVTFLWRYFGQSVASDKNSQNNVIRPSGGRSSTPLKILEKIPESAGDGNLTINITNNDYDAENSRIVTQNEQYQLTGTVTDGDTWLVVVKTEDYAKNVEEQKASGTSLWHANISLKIGTNKITVTAFDKENKTVEKVLYMNRVNKEITYSEKVKLADQEDFSELSNSFVASWVDDNNTVNDVSDDRIIILANDNSLLLKQIGEKKLSKGDVYMIPQCDNFQSGFVGIYEENRAPQGSNEDYPITQYPDAGYQEIVFSYPDIEDILGDQDISLDFSSGFDKNDPVSFAMLGNGTPVDVNESGESNTLVGSTSDTTPSVKKYPRAGFQPEELLNGPELEVKQKTDNSVDVKLKLQDDTVLWDKDGIKNEDGSHQNQVLISGEVGAKGIKHEGGTEWHPSLVPWNLEVFPQQIKSKTTYNLSGNLTFKLSSKDIDTKGWAKSDKKNWENKKSLWGLSIAGVNTFNSKSSTKKILGVIGLNLASLTLTTPCKTIEGVTEQAKVSPTLIFYLFIDLDGKISAEGTIDFNYSRNIEKGYNLQKNGYTGSYGSQNQNRSDKHYTVGSDYTMDIYDTNEGDFKTSLEGKVDMNMDAGFGGGGGIMTFGLIPADINGQIFGRLEGKGNIKGGWSHSSGWTGEVNASIYGGVGTKGAAQMKLVAKKKKENGDERELGGINLSQEWEHMSAETTLSTSELSGIVYVADADGDNSNNTPLADAVVKLKKNDTGKEWTTRTSADDNDKGEYSFWSIPDGEYTLTVSKDGYDEYTNNHLSFSSKLKQNVYLNEHHKIQGICSLQGKITIADTDTDATNNLPLEGATVAIESIIPSDFSGSATTNGNGEYKINNIPSGNYSLTVSKDGYITVWEAVSIAENIENYYNQRLEAISSSYSGTGSGSGAVYDAMTGSGVGGITLEIRRGVNAPEGTVVKTLTTNADGSYLAKDLQAGNYSVKVIDNRSDVSDEEKYSTTLFTLKILGNHHIPNQYGYVTNQVGENQIRIVLRWGENPRDLDSHLTGPGNDGSRFHTAYYDKIYSSNDVKYADLDHDDTTSYGPETTTIYTMLNGTYLFSVHDYTNRYSSNSSALSDSGAYVEVFRGTSSLPIARYDVPSGSGTVWNVFEYDSETNTFTPLNTLEYQSDPSMVGHLTTNSNSIAVNRMRRAARIEKKIPLKDYEVEEQEKELDLAG